MTGPAPHRRRAGPHGYDDLIPDLHRHAAADPHDRGYRARRDHLIREFLPLVRNLARPYAGHHSAEDIEQAGVYGLIRAIDRYDPLRAAHGPLAYLVPSVRGEMKRYLRDRTWAVAVPRGIKDLTVPVSRASDDLTHRLGRSPRPGELARHLGVTVDEIADALGALESYRPVSLDVPDPETGDTVGERVGAEDTALDVAEIHDERRQALHDLPERERTVLLLRFYGNRTQSQIAGEVGLSQMHVSRLLTRTLHVLHDRLAAPDHPGR